MDRRGDAERLEQLAGELAAFMEKDDSRGLDDAAIETLARNLSRFYKAVDDAADAERGAAMIEHVLLLWVVYFSQHHTAMRRVELFSYLADIIHDIPASVWTYLETLESVDLRRTFFNPFNTIMGFLCTGEGLIDDGGFPVCLDRIVQGLEKLEAFLRILIIRPGVAHPVCTLADTAVGGARFWSRNAASEEDRVAGLDRIRDDVERAIAVIGRGAYTLPLERASAEITALMARSRWVRVRGAILRVTAAVLVPVLIGAAFFLGRQYEQRELAPDEPPASTVKPVIEGRKFADPGALLHKAALLSAYADEIVLLGLPGARAERAWIRDQAADVVKKSLHLELAALMKRVGTSLSTKKEFEQCLSRTSGRLRLAHDYLEIEFRNLALGDEALTPLKEALNMTRRLLDEDASAWNDYAGNVRERISATEREVFDAVFWVSAQDKLLEAYAMTEEEVRNPALKSEVLKRRYDELMSRLHRAAEVYRLCYKSPEGRWEPVLTSFVAGNPGFRELFERSLGTGR
jgi:hypothetical protein